MISEIMRQKFRKHKKDLYFHIEHKNIVELIETILYQWGTIPDMSKYDLTYSWKQSPSTPLNITLQMHHSDREVPKMLVPGV